MSAQPIRGRLLAVALVCLPVFGQSHDRAQSPKTEIREIRAIGCVHKALAARCILLVTLDGETTYSFIAAPKPELGIIVTIQGKAHQGPAVCKQGIEIDVADWQPTGDKCTN